MGEVNPNVKYDLTSEEEENFKFSINGHVYIMRYPSMMEIQALSKGSGNTNIVNLINKYVTKEKSSSPTFLKAVDTLQPKSYFGVIKMVRVEVMGESPESVERKIDAMMKAQELKEQQLIEQELENLSTPTGKKETKKKSKTISAK